MRYPESSVGNEPQVRKYVRHSMIFLAKIFYRIFRIFIFRFDSEKIHDAFLNVLSKNKFYENYLVKSTGKILIPSAKLLPPDLGNKNPWEQVLGLQPRNPVGLAAGFDKNGKALDAFALFGFGFVEVGTVTWQPQPGNPKPRIERIVEKSALLNRMGFPNSGADEVAINIRKFRSRVKESGSHKGFLLGVNLGKNKTTPAEAAYFDYVNLIDAFAGLADYLVVNLSSPNTPGLRDLQSLDFLKSLASHINRWKSEKLPPNVPPIFIKLSPTFAQMSAETDFQEICSFLKSDGQEVFSGLVLTNTLPTDLGGISGAPLNLASLECLKKARKFLPTSIPVISVGGIMGAADAKQRFNEGATWVQLYSGLIYQGPSLLAEILEEI